MFNGLSKKDINEAFRDAIGMVLILSFIYIGCTSCQILIP